MARGFSFSIDFNSKAFRKGSDEAAESLDKLGRSLEDVERTDTSKAERGVERVGDATDDTRDKAERLSREFKDTFETTKRGADDAAQGIKRSFDDNQITTADIFRENLRAELVSNMTESGAEVVRGFKDGFDSEDVGTILDGLTDTLFDVGALAGPAGVAGAAAVGSLMQAFAGPLIEEAERNAEDFSSTYSDAFAAIVENGAEMGRELAIQSTVDEFAGDIDRMNEITEQANALGVERGIVLRAMAGDQEAMNVVQAAGNSVLDATAAALEGTSGNTRTLTEEQAAARQESIKVKDALDDVTGSYDNQTGALNAAKDAAAAKAEADDWATQTAVENARKTAEQSGEAQNLKVKLDGVSTAIKVMPDGKIINVDDKDSSKETQAKIDAIEGKTVGVTVVADTGPADAAINRLTQDGRVVRVTAQVTGRTGLYLE